MLKKILIVGAVVALTGCATHQQANTAVGAVVGGAVGHAIGGRGGAAVGAVIGSAMGSQQPTQGGTVIVERQPPVYVERQIVRDCRIYRERERNCYTYRYSDTRAMCIEEERNRYHSCLSGR